MCKYVQYMEQVFKMHSKAFKLHTRAQAPLGHCSNINKTKVIIRILWSMCLGIFPTISGLLGIEKYWDISREVCIFWCRESLLTEGPDLWPGFLRHLVVTCESWNVTERHATCVCLCVFAGSQSCWVLIQGICCSILCMNTITLWILATWPKHTTSVWSLKCCSLMQI